MLLRTVLIAAVLAIVIAPASIHADETELVSKRWLLIACGLPGDEPHRQRLTEAFEKVMRAAPDMLHIDRERIVGLVGDQAMQESLAAVVDQPLEICTRESLERAFKKLSTTVAVDDECWVVLLGHADLYDNHSRFNIQGPDVNQMEFAKWSQTLMARRQVFWVTTPVSGFWLKPLAGPSRIVISATEADQEFTGTEMPYALADVLAGDSQYETLRDVDGDETLSLLDLYLAVNLEIDGRFKALARLQSEHAQLEDNGDGRGSEVQQPYLPAEPEEEPEEDEDEGDEAESAAADEPANNDDPEAEPAEATPPPLIHNESVDGFQSRQVVL